MNTYPEKKINKNILMCLETKPQAIHHRVHVPDVFLFFRWLISHQKCYLLLFKRSCYINWWVKVGVWHWFDWGFLYRRFFFNYLEVYCDCRGLQFPQLTAGKYTVIMGLKIATSSLHTHTHTHTPVLLSRKRMVRFSWAVMEIGWMGWLTTRLIRSLPTGGGKEKHKYSIIVQQTSSRGDIAFINLFNLMWCVELLFSTYVKNGIIHSDVLLNNATYIYKSKTNTI